MEKQRLQFDFSKPAVKRLDQLVNRLGAASRAEVIRRALELIDLISMAKAKKSEIIIKGSDGKEKNIFLL